MPYDSPGYGRHDRRPVDNLIPARYTEGELITHVAERLGISVAQLARLLGVTASCLYKNRAKVAKLHGSAVRLLGLLMEVPGVLTWLITAHELAYGPLPECKKNYTQINYSDGETADWLEPDRESL